MKSVIEIMKMADRAMTTTTANPRGPKRSSMYPTCKLLSCQALPLNEVKLILMLHLKLCSRSLQVVDQDGPGSRP